MTVLVTAKIMMQFPLYPFCRRPSTVQPSNVTLLPVIVIAGASEVACITAPGWQKMRTSEALIVTGPRTIPLIVEVPPASI